MNSEGLMGILIEWLKPENERNYTDLKENVDYRVLNPNKECPVIDGSPIDFTGAPNAQNLEWLVKTYGDRVPGFDFRIYIEDEYSSPTNLPHPDFSNYRQFKAVYSLVRRTNEDILNVIEQIENEANLSIQNESEKAKMQLLFPTVQSKKIAGLALEPFEQEVWDRQNIVSQKAWQNAANAKNLKDAIIAGLTPDISKGWEYDNIPSAGYPFNS